MSEAPTPEPRRESTRFVIRPGSSRSRQNFHLQARLAGSSEIFDPELFQRALDVTLAWFAQKYPAELPPTAHEGKSFELDQFGQQLIQCVALPDRHLWSIRLVQPDAPFKERPAVAGRSWMTEAVLLHDEAGLHFGVRVQCINTSYTDAPIAYTRPRVVVDLARDIGLEDVLPIQATPWMIQQEADVDALLSALSNPDRRIPIVILTQPGPQHAGRVVRDFTLDEEDLAKRLLGLAHVVCLPTAMAYLWTERVGKVWSVYNGALRTYRPGLDFDQDSPYDHELVLLDKILFWKQGEAYGPAPFPRWLIEKLFAAGAGRKARSSTLVYYPEAKTLQAAMQRERILREAELKLQADLASGSMDELRAHMGELSKAHQAELEALREQLEEEATEARTALDLAEESSNLAGQLREDNLKLRGQNDSLRIALKSRGQLDEVDRIPDEPCYEDLPDWVRETLAGRLVLHSRAVGALRKAHYEDVQTVYACLLHLAGAYRDMRMGQDGAREEWEASLGELGVVLSPSISQERAGEEGESYFVRHPQGSGQRRMLDLHLKKGARREDRYCLRLYFFWDDENMEVVVGWLPSHLDTRAT